MTGVAVATHSWGNTRLPNFGITYTTPTVAGRSGVFPVFKNWMDGLIATVERYLAPTWYYHDRPTIGSIFIADGPVWAPAGDLNNPDDYLAGVLDYMNAHADGGTVTPVPYDRTHFSADFGPKRARSTDIAWFIVHDTEGFPRRRGRADLAQPCPSNRHLPDRAHPGGWLCLHRAARHDGVDGGQSGGGQACRHQRGVVAQPAPGETGYTDYQYEKLAEVFRWCVAQGGRMSARLHWSRGRGRRAAPRSAGDHRPSGRAGRTRRLGRSVRTTPIRGRPSTGTASSP
jgi:hypothetical protein